MTNSFTLFIKTGVTVKSLLVLVALFIFWPVKSQPTAFKYKTILAEQVTLDDEGNYVDVDLVEKDKGIVVVMNSEDKRVTFWKNPVKKYDLITQLGNKHKETDKGNWYSYQTIDDKAQECVMRMYFLKSKTQTYAAVIYIDYTNVCFVYYLKSAE